MGGFIVSNHLAYEGLSVDAHYLVAGQHTRFLGRATLNNVLHIDGVVAYGELYAHSGERAFQLIQVSLNVFRAYVYRVRIKVCQYLRYGLVHQFVYVHRVNILVVNDMQQVAEPATAVVDDVDAVA